MNFLGRFTVASDHVLHEVDLNGHAVVNFGKVTFASNDLAGKVVRGRDGRVEERGHATEASCVHGVEVQSTALHAANHCFNGLPNGLVALLDFSTGADDDFIAFGKLTFHDAAADDAASKLGRACTGAVDVEGTSNVHDGALVLGPVRRWNGGLNGVNEDVEVHVVVR